jgi:hypothetical protein
MATALNCFTDTTDLDATELGWDPPRVATPCRSPGAIRFGDHGESKIFSSSPVRDDNIDIEPG